MKQLMIFGLLCLLLAIATSIQITYAKPTQDKNPIAASNEIRSMKDINQLAKSLNMNPQHLRLALIVSEDLNIASFEQAKSYTMQDLLHVISYIHSGELSEDWVLPTFKLTYFINSGQLVKLMGGSHHTLALGPNSEVFTWGYGNDGQLANGTFVTKYLPSEVTPFFNLGDGEVITDVTTGDSHLAAITSNHRVFTWGNNRYGQLGNGNKINQNIPQDITGNLGLTGDEYATSIHLSGYHTMVLTSHKRVLSWGWGIRSQIGNGSTQDQPLPVDITQYFNLAEGEYVKDVYGAWGNVMALTNYERFFGWGYNYDGAVGDGSRTNRAYPVDVTNNLNLQNGETIIQMTAGVHHNILLTSNHRVIGMGYNRMNQIGEVAATFYVTLPLDITHTIPLDPDEVVIQVSPGTYHTMVLTSKQRVFSWGENYLGQVGDGAWIQVNSPKEVTPFYPLHEGETIVRLALQPRASSSYVFTSENRLFANGRNAYGVLGVNDTINRNLPIDVTFYEGLKTLDEVILTWGTSINYDIDPNISTWYLDEEMSIISDYKYMPANDLILYGKP